MRQRGERGVVSRRTSFRKATENRLQPRPRIDSWFGRCGIVANGSSAAARPLNSSPERTASGMTTVVFKPICRLFAAMFSSIVELRRSRCNTRTSVSFLLESRGDQLKPRDVRRRGVAVRVILGNAAEPSPARHVDRETCRRSPAGLTRQVIRRPVVGGSLGQICSKKYMSDSRLPVFNPSSRLVAFGYSVS